MSSTHSIMKTQDQPTISILGKGAVGTALAHQCVNQGLRVKIVRILGSSENSDDYSLESWLSNLSKNKLQQHWVILTVPDDAIIPTADKIQKLWQSTFQKPISSAMNAILHTSGVHSSEDFERFQDQGVLTGSMHPIQTFQKPIDSPTQTKYLAEHNPFTSINITLEGDASFLPMLTQFCSQILRAHPLEVTRDQKQQIHAAAVLASNCLFPSLSIASMYLKDVGLSPKLLEPLASQTVNVALAHGFDAISGPIARLDNQTVLQNMNALHSHETAKKRYVDESIYLLNQLLKAGHYDGRIDQAQELLKMLHSEQ